jgi:DNA-binding transcriptional LysR family regulator
MAPGHPLSRKKHLRLKDLTGQAFVSFGSRDPYRRRLDVLLDQHGIQRQIVAETSSATSLCALVRSGIGLAVVNPITPRFTSGHGLTCVSLRPSISYEVDVVQPINRPSNPLINLFLADLQQCLEP